MTEPFEQKMRRGGAAALAEVEAFFGASDSSIATLRAIALRMNEMGLAYAVAGTMAMIVHGYGSTTLDVQVLVTRDAAESIHTRLLTAGYARPLPGSRDLCDTKTGVRIRFIFSGENYRGVPVVFPEPHSVSIEVAGIRYVNLPTLVELKLASGMRGPERLIDLADVQELIRALGLNRAFAAQLDPHVGATYDELWMSIQQSPDV